MLARIAAALGIVLSVGPALADDPVVVDKIGAFCELTPCVPGTLTRRKLTKHEPGGPVTCKKGHDLGINTQTKALVTCTTAKAVVVDGIPVAADAYTLFHPNGRLYQSHASAAFDRTVADGSKVRCAAELFALEDDGKLRYCTLAAPRAGSPRARVKEGIAFHPAGRVSGMTLDEPYTAAGIKLMPGARVHWDPKGTLLGGWTTDPIVAGTLTISSDFRVHPNGTLHTVTLGKPARLAGIEFPERAELTFRADGTLEAAEYLAKIGFMIHGERWTDTRHVGFDKAGKITSDYIDHYQSTVRPPKFRK